MDIIACTVRKRTLPLLGIDCFVSKLHCHKPWLDFSLSKTHESVAVNVAVRGQKNRFVMISPRMEQP